MAEHIIHAHPAIVLHLKLLFSMILAPGFVPDGFGSGIIIPVLKINVVMPHLWITIDQLH